MPEQTLYVTTTIPYVNAQPHVGFALELVQADAIARYHRLRGNRVHLQTGTDENAFKNVVSARARGVAVEAFVEENAAKFRNLAESLDISFDGFIRTTSPRHRHAVSTFLSHLQQGDVYRTSYEGLYCTDCEDFYLARDLHGTRCPEHQRVVSRVNEHNYFFRLSRYQQPLQELISSRALRVLPEERENEVLQFLDRGLSDISISRDAKRSQHWGIPFPNDPTQVVYVWIDALVNYLSGLGYPDSCAGRFWNREATKVHLIGKNVWKFHAVYWPALLLSVGLPLPDLIVAHGFLTHEGKKISKSAGATVDPNTYVHRFGVDAVRYYLLRYVRPFNDTDFSTHHLTRIYNTDLANGLGNLLSRLIKLREVCAVERQSHTPLRPPPEGFYEFCDAFRFDLALESLWREISRINREINDVRPWEETKHGGTATARAKVQCWIDELLSIAHYLEPFLPTTSKTICAALTDATKGLDAPLFPRKSNEVDLP